MEHRIVGCLTLTSFPASVSGGGEIREAGTEIEIKLFPSHHLPTSIICINQVHYFIFSSAHYMRSPKSIAII